MKEMCAKIKHGKISMTKPLEFYSKQLFFPNPLLDLCHTSKSSCLGGVKGSHQISTPLVWLSGSYTCWKQWVLQWNSWKDFHDKALGVLFQIVVFPKSTVGFVSNFNQFFFRRCRRVSPNFNTIGVVVRELHLLEVEGVEFVCFFPQSKQSDQSQGLTLDNK